MRRDTVLALLQAGSLGVLIFGLLLRAGATWIEACGAAGMFVFFGARLLLMPGSASTPKEG